MAELVMVFERERQEALAMSLGQVTCCRWGTVHQDVTDVVACRLCGATS